MLCARAGFGVDRARDAVDFDLTAARVGIHVDGCRDLDRVVHPGVGATKWEWATWVRNAQVDALAIRGQAYVGRLAPGAVMLGGHDVHVRGRPRVDGGLAGRVIDAERLPCADREIERDRLGEG